MNFCSNKQNESEIIKNIEKNNICYKVNYLDGTSNSFYTNDKFNQSNKILIWEDYNIQQGIEYQYGLQFFNIYGIYSNKKLSQIVNADFEDAFLLDGDRQNSKF